MRETIPVGQRTRVLIVDDSAAMRAILKKILQADPRIDVVGTAADAEIARRMLKELNPDVLLLDVEMPGTDGITFLQKIMRLKPMPVVMCSSLTAKGTDTTIEAMRLGAVECIGKPAGGADALLREAKTLREAVKAAARSTMRPISHDLPRAAAPTGGCDPELVIAIGASTGGVEALFSLLSALPPDIPPTLVVQHMPGLFTSGFAARLDRTCPMRVTEARDGEKLMPGTVYIAPGSDAHMELYGGRHGHIRLRATAAVSGHRPSADVLFRSCASLGKKAVGVIMTGMGKDGAQGLHAMHKAGALTLGQDENSCVIYGMPRAAKLLGAITREVSLDALPKALLRACREPLGREIMGTN
ncbi:MAG: chemotaxis response regulator protein-glutamate methylesterase [Sphingomonadaceae bacterium]